MSGEPIPPTAWEWGLLALGWVAGLVGGWLLRHHLGG